MGYNLDLEMDKMYLPPIGFGPCKRDSDIIKVNSETGKIELDQFLHAVNHILIYETSPVLLEKLLPPKCSVDKPYMIVTHRTNYNTPVFAGRSYSLIQYAIPVRFSGEKDNLRGNFVVMIWENNGDCMPLGRDRLGYCKMYADISEVTGRDGHYNAFSSNWGYRFLDLNFDLNAKAPNLDEMNAILDDQATTQEINYVYRTKIGALGLDSDYFTLLPKGKELVYPDNCGEIPPKTTQYGTGEILWHEASFEQVPTQYYIIEALGNLPVKRVVGCVRTEYYHLGNYDAIRIIE